MDNGHKQLREAFRDPPAAVRPMMFWIWNGKLEPDRIRHQVADIADKGCGGFLIHPMGEHFRLDDFVKGMEPPYLSDAYFDAVRTGVRAAKQHGLYVWLYDEGGWPSGTAQGHVLDGHPEQAARLLKCLRIDSDPADSFACPENCVAAVAAFPDAPPQALPIDCDPVPIPDRALSIVCCIVETAQPMVDLLSEEAVQRFIAVTHQRYAEAVGDYFGDVVIGMFTDEPRVVGMVGTDCIPWTGGMLEAFQHQRGFDLRPFLPLLFSKQAAGHDFSLSFDAGRIAQIRCEFCDHWTDLYQRAYWQQINRWCRRHDLIHTGHVGGEDNLPDHIHGGFGHYFKTAGSLHAPGVDAIKRQLHWDEGNFPFPRFAPSAANRKQSHRNDETDLFTNLCVTETNGAYGMGLTLAQMRWLADYQGLCGVNTICPMSYSYETSQGRLYRTMDHIGPGNPQWPFYRGYADYVGRLCTILRATQPLADIAVYYPIEVFWAAMTEYDPHRTWQSMQALCAALDHNQVPFDFVDAVAIGQATVADGTLETPRQMYGTVVVPDAPVLPTNVAEQLLALCKSGGHVAFVGALPDVTADLGDDERFDAIIDQLSHYVNSLVPPHKQTTLSGDTRSGLDEAARWDGLAAGLGMPQADYPPVGVLDETPAILVQPSDLPYFGRAVALRSGYYGFQPMQHTPQLRMATRNIGDAQIALLMNESRDPLSFQMETVSAASTMVERWDATDGSIETLAVQNTPTDTNRIALTLGPGESTVLSLTAFEHPPDPTVQPMPHTSKSPESETVAMLDQPDRVYVHREYCIERGDVRIIPPDQAYRELPTELGPFSDVELDGFSGTVGYEFTVSLSQQEVRDDLFLNLGEVCYCARVTINGQQLNPSIWPPHVWQIDRYLHKGENHIQVLVTNTLANQLCSSQVIAQAEQNGWFNTYYRATLDFMTDSLRSGLIGPVRLSTVSQ